MGVLFPYVEEAIGIWISYDSFLAAISSNISTAWTIRLPDGQAVSYFNMRTTKSHFFVWKSRTLNGVEKMEYWETLGFGGWDLAPEALLERREGYLHSRNMGISFSKEVLQYVPFLEATHNSHVST